MEATSIAHRIGLKLVSNAVFPSQAIFGRFTTFWKTSPAKLWWNCSPGQRRRERKEQRQKCGCQSSIWLHLFLPDTAVELAGHSIVTSWIKTLHPVRAEDGGSVSTYRMTTAGLFLVTVVRILKSFGRFHLPHVSITLSHLQAIVSKQQSAHPDRVHILATLIKHA